MTWQPVMVMPDGTEVQMQLPGADRVEETEFHCYRVVRRDSGVATFETLADVADYLRDLPCPGDRD